uniref:Glutathione transferase n=2 Tax=Clastoptera arizonana TaxID=38151 RepID=A0A1B6EAL0_9HEMI
MTTKHLSTGSKDPVLQKGKIRLYSMRFCPFAERVHLVLAAKKVPHDVVYINLMKKPEWYLEKVPSGKVPAIVIEDELLYESLIICDFLDEQFPLNPLHPKDPIKKSKDRLLIESLSKVTVACYKLSVSPAVEKQMVEELYLGLDDFERELVKRGTPYFGGDQIGMADYMIWPWCERLEMINVLSSDQFQFKFPKERFMRLVEWSKAMIEDEAVKSIYLEPHIHAKYLSQKRAGVLDYDNVIP